MESKKYIVFQAYNSIDIINECKLALLSLIKVDYQFAQKEIEIIIFTDQKEEFNIFEEALTIHFHLLDQEKVKEFRGDIDFVHRVKIKVLQEVARRYAGLFLYCDTDVLFQFTINELFDKINDSNFYMHLNEGLISKRSNPILKKTDDFLRSGHQLKTSEGKKYFFSNSLIMYNAGVLGFPSNKAYLLNDVLDLTDKMYQLFPKHIVEQFAFSYVLQTNGTVWEANEQIFHYWNLKEIRPYIQSFLDKNKDLSITMMAQKITELKIVQQSDLKASFYSQNGLIRAIKRLFKKGFELNVP